MKIKDLSEINFGEAGKYELESVVLSKVLAGNSASNWVEFDGNKRRFKAWLDRRGGPALVEGLAGSAVIEIKLEEYNGKSTLAPWLMRFAGDCDPDAKRSNGGGGGGFNKAPAVDVPLELLKLSVQMAIGNGSDLEGSVAAVLAQYKRVKGALGS